ncbi:MAG: biopolymer transporter ExbD [Thermoguttaceae bacterium]
MKFSRSDGDFSRLEMNLTPMIDICFQLIIFFIANMRLVQPEGDFNIAMPQALPSGTAAATAGTGQPGPTGGVATPGELPATRVHLMADDAGELSGIVLGQRKLASFKELGRQIREMSGLDRAEGGNASLMEVEIDSDENLRYEFVMRAVDAISGYVSEDKHTFVRMVEKIRFGTIRKQK